MIQKTEISFKLGRLVSTRGALEAITNSGDDFAKLIGRHLSLEQGELSEGDHQMNLHAAKYEDGRIFSAFLLSDGTKIWIITEHDRKLTTFLLPEEY